jgi:hypothetical protein
MDVQDLQSPLFVGKRNLHVDFESARSQQSLVDHVQSVGHTDDEYIVELVYTVHLQYNSVNQLLEHITRQVYLGQKLIDNAVTHARTVVRRSTLLADCIKLVENDDMQPALFALGFVL